MRKIMKKGLSLVLCALLVVSAVPLSSHAAAVKISKKSATVYAGKTLKLKMKNTKKTVKWSTSNKKIATVSKKGVVTAKKDGKAVITAKIGKSKYTCKVTVKSRMNVTKKTLTEKGTCQLKQYGLTNVKWKSSNTKVATVTQKGKVTAKKAGTATITAYAGKKKVTCKITVKAQKTPVTPIEPETPTKPEDYIDFIVDVPEGRDIRVLQLTDTQILDADQTRPGRTGVDLVNWASDKMDEKCFNYLRKTVRETTPDLIIMTGDLVYGEFDDAGTSLIALINCMEELGIPWAPVFGNHDNESKKGVDWQCQQLEAAEHCLFKQRTLTGNGNYTVGVRQGDKVKRVFFMLDSNGCGDMSDESFANGHSQKAQGFGKDQIAWYTDVAQKIKKSDASVKISFAFHIQLYVFGDAFAKYGFTNSGTKNNPIDIDKQENKAETDFGYIGRDLKGPWDASDAVYESIKALGADSIFVGHEHCNSASVVYEGIRFQYGQKTGTYDRANYLRSDGTIIGSYDVVGIPIVGGTMIPLSEEDGSIKNPYIYYCESLDLPNEPNLEVAGLQYGTDLTCDGAMTVTTDTVGGENAYKCTGVGQGKLFVSPSLFKDKDTFTFSVYLETPGTCLDLNDNPEFAIRVKPNDLEPSLDGSTNGYIEYSSTVGDVNRKLIANEWKTFTVDISKLGENCTEFAFNIAKGGVIYLRDLKVEKKVADPENPVITVGGLQLGKELTADAGMTVETATIGGKNAYKCTGLAQGKLRVSTELLKNKSTFTFSVYLETPGTCLDLNDDPEFAIRVKPNDLEPGLDGKTDGYVQFSSTVDDANRKLVANEWKTFTVDISGLDETCTEFAFNIAKDGVIYLCDIQIQ